MITRRACFPLALGAVALPALPAAARTRKLVIHVNDNDESKMQAAMTIVRNVSEHYARYGDDVDVRIVAIGGGLTLFRADKSNYASSLRRLKTRFPRVQYLACGNTMKGTQDQERLSGPIPLLPDVQVVETGVAALMELQEKGFSYVRP